MRYKKFKNLSISTLELGGLRFPTQKGQPNHIDRIEGQKVVDAALSSGINYIDTSHTYQQGDSERFLGEALSNYPRDSYYLATKFYVTYASDIPLLIQAYNEDNISGSTWKIPNLAQSKSALECQQCGICVQRCPQNIDVLQVMQKIASKQLKIQYQQDIKSSIIP